MARPPRKDRTSVREIMLTIKLTPEDQARLDAVAEARAEATLMPVNKSAMIRYLIAKEAKAIGWRSDERAQEIGRVVAKHAARKRARTKHPPK